MAKETIMENDFKLQWAVSQTGREGLVFSELIKWHRRKVYRTGTQ